MNQEPEMATRKVRMMMVNPADFMSLFGKGLKVRKGFKIIEGLPDDAKLINIAYDAMRGAVQLVVESETFDAIPITVLPPVQVVKIAIGRSR